MLRTFDGIALRQLRSRRLRALLTSFGIVLGVGMVFGVLTLSGTIKATFGDVIDSAFGSKDLIVVPRGGVMPDRTLAQVRATPGVAAAGGMAGAIAARLDAAGKPMDGMTNRVDIAAYDPASTPPYDFKWTAGRPPRSGVELVLEQNWAADHGVRVGDRLALGTPTGPRRIPVVGLFRFSDNLSLGGQGLAAMPLAAGRRVFAVPHGWYQISLTLQDGADLTAVRTALERKLGRGVDVQTPSALTDQINEQTRALNTLLLFFSGIALFTGGFLILNSFSMTVTQRTRELGMLRTLGATRRMIRRTVVTEALLLGVLGSVIGLAFGLGLAAGLISLIKGLGIPVGHVRTSAGDAALAVTLGLVTTAFGAWWPARRAGRTSPVVAAQGGTMRPAPSLRRVLLGVAFMLPGIVFGGGLWFDQGSDSDTLTLVAIALTMLMLAGIAMAAPGFITPLVRLVSWPLRRLAPTAGRLASDAAGRDRGRTAATAVALTLGLSVIVVNAAMSASFIGQVRDQIDRGYARDLTVRVLGSTLRDGSGRPVAPDLQARLRTMPAVGTVSAIRAVPAELPGLPSSQPYGLIMGVDPATFPVVDRTPVIGADDAAAMRALAAGQVIVGRQYAREQNLQVGDRLTLDGPRARRSLRIAGLRDEFSDFGGNVVYMSQASIAAIYNVTHDAELLVRAASPARRDELTRSVKALLARSYPDLEAVSTAAIKRQVSREIDRQFALFNAIVAIAVIVSILGVVNTLAMSVLERRREIGVLRALGSSRWLVRMTMVDESLLITVSGALAGLALGLAIAWNWIRDLDTMLPGARFTVPYGVIIGVAVAAVVLGALAAALPARRAARIDVVDALGYE